MKRVVVVGGGVSGLTTGLHLLDRRSEVAEGLEVQVLEASDAPGGNIRTRRDGGFVIERGPNGYLDNVPTTPALVRRLGLEGQVQKADASAAKRYLYRNGRLHLLPTGPLGFLLSPVLSLPGRLRVFGEPFAGPKPEGVDETIFEFAARRIGVEAASILIDAMVSGVFAGNVHELSLAAAFPRMSEMEAEHGGLVRAMLARMRERRRAKQEVEARRARGEDVEDLVQPGGPAGPGGTLTSFRNGLDTLPFALATELGASLRLGIEVEGVARTDREGEGEAGGRPWVVRLRDGGTLSADAVLLAVPAPKAHPLLAHLDGDLAQVVASIRTAPLAVVAVALDAGGWGEPRTDSAFWFPETPAPGSWDASGTRAYFPAAPRRGRSSFGR